MICGVLRYGMPAVLEATSTLVGTPEPIAAACFGVDWQD